MFRNKKGMASLIELMAAGLIAIILMAASAYYLLPVQQTLTSMQRQAGYQVLADRLMKFTHDQVVYASQIKIADNRAKLGKDYTSVLGVQGGKAVLNGSEIYDFPDGVEIETEVTAISETYFVYEIRVLDTKSTDLLYKVTQTMTIPFFVETSNSGEAYTVDGDLIDKVYLLDETDGESLNLFIGYNRTSLSGYEINTLADGIKANYEKLIKEFIATPKGERKAIYGFDYVNNDRFRGYLSVTFYDGAWPIVPRGEGGTYPSDLHLDNKKTYYIQPYYFASSSEDTALNEDGTGDITIFLKDSLGAGWHIMHMYDHEERQWYRKKLGGYSCSRAFELNKIEMHNANWLPVDFENGSGIYGK